MESDKDTTLARIFRLRSETVGETDTKTDLPLVSRRIEKLIGIALAGAVLLAALLAFGVFSLVTLF